jgi:glutamate N-acetyltransferase/amino-acid N-acetyltransferase
MSEKAYKIEGFKGSAVAAGLKKGGEPDLALIFSEKEAVAAGVFTTNRVQAAPVIQSRENIKNGRVRAIVVNSGNANACTGETGLENTRLTAAYVAENLGIEPNEVLVASTGVIGAQLDMKLISKAIPGLARSLSSDGITRVAEAMMTTDSFSKISWFEGKMNEKPFQILGIAKGAGMIMPNMATMLCFVLTDMTIDAPSLDRSVSAAVESSFNRISVDGDTSTNDMVLVLANGRTEETLSSEGLEEFNRGLTAVMKELATMIVRDGEGATKVVHVTAKGAATAEDALAAARTVANSSLVKTAFYGQDPNWGRIMAALGRSGIRMHEENVSIWIDGVKIVEGGLGSGEASEKEAAEIMTNKEFILSIDLHQGEHEDTIITCDLTHEYININADYRT